MTLLNFSAALLLLFGGAAFAAPITYVVDSSHTFPSFETDHTGLSLWRGKVNSTKGSVVLDREAKTGEVDLTMDMSTIDFGLEVMNKRAISETILDVARFPFSTYKGKLVFKGDVPVAVEGVLTLHGISLPVRVEIKSFGCKMSAFLKREICGADASATFSRDDFGLIVDREHGSKPAVRLAIAIEARRAD